jgi:hypothetical protein
MCRPFGLFGDIANAKPGKFPCCEINTTVVCHFEDGIFPVLTEIQLFPITCWFNKRYIQYQKKLTPYIMKTNVNETVPDVTDPGNETIPVETRTRMVFFGPSEMITRIAGIDGQEIGEPVNRKEIKNMAVAYADRVVSFPVLDQNKEPLVLLIKKSEIKELISDPQCTQIKAMLAVEINDETHARHQTFVLMPCDEEGAVIQSSAGQSGMERWKIVRNVKSVTRYGSTEFGVEQFLTGDLRI